jgi:hypothetical protein
MASGLPQLHPTGASASVVCPAFRWGDNGFGVHGLETGVEFRY